MVSFHYLSGPGAVPDITSEFVSLATRQKFITTQGSGLSYVCGNLRSF